MIKLINLKILFFLLIFLPLSHALFPSRNTSRYFPFLEKPEDYVCKTRKSNLTPYLFLSTSSTAYKRDGGNSGIPELWGNYDLKDIIFSLKQVDNNYTDPTVVEKGTDDWVGKSIKFHVDGKTTARGVCLGYNQDLHFYGFSLGFFVPFAYVNTTSRFVFDEKNSEILVGNLKIGEKRQIDRIRARVHNDLDLQGLDWSDTGFGDLDVFVNWNYNLDHKFLIKNIDCNLRLGFLCPTGISSDIDNPISVPFTNNNHWGIYFDTVFDFELRQDLRFGIITGFADLFKKTETRRISVYKEPVIFSPLKADVEINPGFTFKISPYIELANLRDGLNLQARYTYLRHSSDSWNDLRSQSVVKSYLDQRTIYLQHLSDYPNYVDDEKIRRNKSEKEYLSRWRSHYITLQVTFDSKQAFNNWFLQPTFYFIYDYPAGGSGIAKDHHVSISAELHF